MKYKVILTWREFINGYYNVLVSLTTWLLTVLSREADNSEDFWASLNVGSGGWILYQYLLVLTMGYNLNTRQKINTFPEVKEDA